VNLKELIQEKNWTEFPIGLSGCRISNYSFEQCDYDITVFDNTSQDEEIISFQNSLVNVHHGSLSETKTNLLIRYDNMQIIQDESWDLRMFLSKIKEKRLKLFRDYAKNCLLESIFCCEKTKIGINESSVFAPYWQKCASYFLAEGIVTLNQIPPSPSHMLGTLRNFEKNPINEKISIVNETVGIERSTSSLLERMVKSTIGFSDLFEKNKHSLVIQRQHDYFVKNSMFSDCYFYLGFINKENFVKYKDSILRNPDIIHILKVSFDIDADNSLIDKQADLIQKSSNDILEYLSKIQSHDLH